MNDQTVTYQFSIGANNLTGKLELDKIEAITLKHYPEGATIMTQGITGIWKGGTERSAIVIASGTKATAHDFMDELKIVLDQEKIGKTKINNFELY